MGNADIGQNLVSLHHLLRYGHSVNPYLKEVYVPKYIFIAAVLKCSLLWLFKAF